MTFPAALLILLLQAPEPPKASISGVVLNAVNGEPLAKAQIRLDRGSMPPVGADSQGRFVIQNLQPGSYIVTAERNGFAPQEYGARAPGRPGIPLTIVSGQAFIGAVF